MRKVVRAVAELARRSNRETERSEPEAAKTEVSERLNRTEMRCSPEYRSLAEER